MTCNKIQVPYISIQVDNNNMYTADQWMVVLDMINMPKSLSSNDLLANTDIMVEIYVGYPLDANKYNIADLAQVMKGKMDNVRADFLNLTLTLTGRDLTAVFLQTNPTNNLMEVNATSYQIIQKIVEAAGLKFVGTPTSVPVGKFYFDSYFFQPTLKTNWDLMVSLAQAENYNLYIVGDTVVYNPKGSEQTYTVDYKAGAINSSTAQMLSVNRIISISHAVEVNILSYNQQSKKVYIGQATFNPIAGDPGTQDPIKYRFSIPNLSQSQANSAAQNLINMITLHAISMNFTIPGDVTVTKDKIIKLKGTATVADQIYYPFMIRHEVSLAAGYSTSVMCRNTIGQIRGA